MQGGSQRRVSRRPFIKAVAGGTIALSAGCLGDARDGDTGDTGAQIGGTDDQAGNTERQDPGTTNVVMVSTQQGGSVYPGAQGLAAAINEESDEVFIDSRPSDGARANIGLLNREDADVGMISSWDWRNLREGNEPFGDVDFEPVQIMHFYSMGFNFMAPSETGLTSIADVEPGFRLFPTPIGSGASQFLMYTLDNYVTEDYEPVPTGFSEQPSALAEGRIDLGTAAAINGSLASATVDQAAAAVDLNILSWVEEAQDDELLVLSDNDPAVYADISGIEHVPDPLRTLDLTYSWVARPNYDYDAVYELVSAAYERREELDEYAAMLAVFEDGSHFAHAPMPELPFHEAAADFFEEVGIWDDEQMSRA